MTTTVITNPTVVTVGDASISAQSVTSFRVLAGTVTGGPYTSLVGTVPNSSLTDSATGATGPFADITWTPAPTPFVTYFCVVESVNAQGDSVNSPEAAFLLDTAPSAPVSLVFS
jgi:hypothetical protein